MKKLILLLAVSMSISICARAQDTDAKVSIGGKTQSQDSILFVVDGKQWQRIMINLDQSADKKESDPFDLDPSDIETVEVIKGEDAVRQYGQKGKNGVVVITTKESYQRKKKIQKAG